MLNGHCECGVVRITVDAPIEEVMHCHCSQCRRLHGGAFASFAAVPRNAVRFTSGEAGMSRYASSAEIDRLFCAACGSTILADATDEPERLYLSLSILAGNPSLPRAYHVFVGSKAPWHEITDDLAQFEENPP